LELAPGDRFLHIGCGVGYYTAIAAEAISPGGSAVGIEIDPQMADRARRNLQRWKNVSVLTGDAFPRNEVFDAILVNAGATAPSPVWLDALRAGGRLLVPLTVGAPGQNLGAGHMLLVTRHLRGNRARFVSTVGIFHCSGARTDEGSDLLSRSYQGGGADAVRSLRRDAHEPDPSCWLHAGSFCLSRLEVGE
jgi:protein-L-isoaspartate(D-aspartate) O-methyltransferase